MATAYAGRTASGLGAKLARLHWPFVTLVLIIGLAGYAVLYSAAGGSHTPWAWRHGLRLLVGIPIMLALALIDIRLYFRIAYALYGLALALLMAVEALGQISKGAQRWLDLGLVQLQPSELMKVALVLALARYFHSASLEDTGRPTFLILPVCMILAPAGLVLVQPDLGTAVMLAATGTALLFMAGVRLWKFAAVGGIAAAALPVAWARMHGYQKARILTFLDPEADPLGSGYHIIQSKIALGSGGFWGKGFLHGTQAQLSFLPEKQTDFAFTSMAEETGFVGAVATLALFAALLMTALVMAVRASSQFARLLGIGMTVNLSLYVIINVAMVTGLIPVVGVPLPLVSYGGTAMLTSLTAGGLLLSIDLHRDVQLPRYPAEL